jgi:hypothetical protein
VDNYIFVGSKFVGNDVVRDLFRKKNLTDLIKLLENIKNIIKGWPFDKKKSTKSWLLIKNREKIYISYSVS